VAPEFIMLALLALAGFLVGGVYSTWKTARGLAVVLGAAALLAAGGALAWWVSA
jgi:hypothetical protein